MQSLENIIEKKKLTNIDVNIRTTHGLLEEAARVTGTCVIEKDGALENTALIYAKTKEGKKGEFMAALKFREGNSPILYLDLTEENRETVKKLLEKASVTAHRFEEARIEGMKKYGQISYEHKKGTLTFTSKKGIPAAILEKCLPEMVGKGHELKKIDGIGWQVIRKDNMEPIAKIGCRGEECRIMAFQNAHENREFIERFMDRLSKRIAETGKRN